MNAQTFSPPEPQEVPQPLETANPPLPESTIAVAAEPEPTELQPVATEAVYQAEPVQAQPVSAKPADQAESTLSQPVPTEPVDLVEPAPLTPVLAEAASAETVSTTLVDVAEPIDVAEPETPHGQKSAHLAIPVPKKIDKASLPAGPKKAALASAPTPNKKPVQATATAASKKNAWVKAPVDAKKPAQATVPVALKQVAKLTATKHKLIGKATPVSTKPIHPATASILQDNRKKSHTVQTGEKKQGEKMHIAKR